MYDIKTEDEESKTDAIENTDINERKPNWKINRKKQKTRVMEKDGYTYHLHKSSANNRGYMSCTMKKSNACTAKAIVDLEKDLIIEISYNEEHNHKPDHTSSIVKALEEEAIQRGLKDVNLKALDLYKSFKENVLRSEVGEKGLPYIRTHYNFIAKLNRRKLECGLKEKKLAGGKRPRRKFY